jgi:tRNA uridine 5-carboxymethylaminomethyl modification enzyme
VRHQVFLEPEGLDTTEMYVNGLSTSLPPAVQLAYLRAVPGLESVEMTRPGYAIEYDYFPPTQLDRSLKVKGVEGLYFAGQINGTTGYEEAAGQGIVAGINAGLHVAEREPVRFGRDQAFLGVLVDDLVTRGVDEPYRLFTSRAEFRLILRQDNALRRLYPLAARLGLLTDDERRRAEERLNREEKVLATALETSIHPETANAYLVARGSEPIRSTTRVGELANRPGLVLDELLALSGVEPSGEASEWASVELRYRGYIEREREAAGRLERLEGFAIPEDFAYEDAVTLSYEAREKLSRRRPTSLGEAARIPGVRPSDLQNLLVEVVKRWRTMPGPSFSRET